MLQPISKVPSPVRCDNCSRIIGKLETPHVWNEHVICAACRDTLSAQQAPAAVEPISYATPAQRRRPRKFKDHLQIPRMIILILAILFSVIPYFAEQEHPSYILAWIFWGMWIMLGLASMIMKANWKGQGP